MDVLSFALIQQNPAAMCPPEIFDRLVAVPVRFFNFERRKTGGFIVVDHALADDVRGLFDEVIFPQRFPIASAIPVSFAPILFDDDRSMALNNTSGFNYRSIAGTKRLSRHARGRALDINPRLNPCIKDGIAQPPGVTYVPTRRGTLTAESPVVKYLKMRGWTWGGDWISFKDYQHFEKF